MPYSFDKRTHKSKGKAGKIPHPAGASSHSGATKNKLRKALEAREDKVRRKKISIPTMTLMGLLKEKARKVGHKGPTKGKPMPPKFPISPDLGEDYTAPLEEYKPPKNWMEKQKKERKKWKNFTKPDTIEVKGGGKVKGYKKGGPITYRMAGGQVVDNSYD